MTLKQLESKFKKAHKSLTLWFNAVGMLWLQAAFMEPMLLTFLSANGLLWIVIVGNIVIRVFKTSSSLEDKQ